METISVLQRNIKSQLNTDISSHISINTPIIQQTNTIPPSHQPFVKCGSITDNASNTSDKTLTCETKVIIKKLRCDF